MRDSMRASPLSHHAQVSDASHSLATKRNFLTPNLGTRTLPDPAPPTFLPCQLVRIQAAQRLMQYGRNELPEEKTPAWKIFLRQFTGSMPFMLEACIVVSMIVALAGQTEAWEDFGIIFAMVVINACIGFHEESKAQASLDGLKGSLTTTVPCIRDGRPISLDIGELVPGDIISLRGGDAVPADCDCFDGDTI